MRILTKASEVTKKQAEAHNSNGKISVEEDVLKIAKKAWAKANRSYILIDILAILPIPQVGMFVFFSKMKGPGCSIERRTPVLGGLWYFFAIQREMDCWHYVCQSHTGCQPSTFSCSERRDRLRTISLLDEQCPINLPEEMKGKPFNFGIFANALDSGLVQSIDFPQKFLNCFWWGLRNLSSLGQNLQTSTYAWENLFAVFISIIGLLLFIYLIGNLQIRED
ncbi:hypothetical protein ABKV19_026185 [Rosa sericea]